MPSVLLADVAPAQRGGGLALGRYYPVIVESEAEWFELEAFLDTTDGSTRAPDLLDRRPSMMRTDAILVLRYDPPAASWPWLSLTCWPADIRAHPAVRTIDLARGCYTMEASPHLRRWKLISWQC